MGKRLRQEIVTSEEDENLTPPDNGKQKRRRFQDEEAFDSAAVDVDGGGSGSGSGGREESEDDGGEANTEDATPIGKFVKISGKGKKRKRHYNSFEFDGNAYELEDSVLLAPIDKLQKPHIAILKDITQGVNGSLMVTGQWFYRPEEAEKKGGGRWESQDARELFYSFHLDTVPAESVMHKCVVHYVPLHKKIPIRSQHPGFIVQQVYDVVEKKLRKFTDKNYEENKQHEINILVQKTILFIGELPDIEAEEAPADNCDHPTSKCKLSGKNMHPIDVFESEDAATRSEHLMKAETPGSCPGNVSEYHVILAKFNALTGITYRDRWLEKLLQGIQIACKSKQDASTEDKTYGSVPFSDHTINTKNGSSTVTESKDESSEVNVKMESSTVVSENTINSNNIAASSTGLKDGSREVNDDVKNNFWPATAVMAITALEKASHEAFSSDFQKYNQKMRKMDFNLKNNNLLARRLLNKELDPVVILNMSPDELKDGLIAEEKTITEPEESKRMQMTEARCSRCTEKKVGIADIIHAGRGDRYQERRLSDPLVIPHFTVESRWQPGTTPSLCFSSGEPMTTFDLNVPPKVKDFCAMMDVIKTESIQLATAMEFLAYASKCLEDAEDRKVALEEAKETISTQTQTIKNLQANIKKFESQEKVLEDGQVSLHVKLNKAEASLKKARDTTDLYFKEGQKAAKQRDKIFEDFKRLQELGREHGIGLAVDADDEVKA